MGTCKSGIYKTNYVLGKKHCDVCTGNEANNLPRCEHFEECAKSLGGEFGTYSITNKVPPTKKNMQKFFRYMLMKEGC